MGTEEFWVPAVLAAASAGTQAINQSQANSRQQAAETQSILNQEQLRQQANGQVRQLTNQIAQDNPNQIAAKSTGDYVSQLRKNAAGSTEGGSTKGGTQTGGASVSSLPAAAGADARYGQDLANSQKEVQDYGDTYANEMGALDAATRMRTNEGLAMGTEEGNLNTLGLQSYGQNFVDQLRSQAAGQPNPWVSLGAGLLGNGARAYAINAGSVPASYAESPQSVAASAAWRHSLGYM